MLIRFLMLSIGVVVGLTGCFGPTLYVPRNGDKYTKIDVGLSPFHNYICYRGKMLKLRLEQDGRYAKIPVGERIDLVSKFYGERELPREGWGLGNRIQTLGCALSGSFVPHSNHVYKMMASVDGERCYQQVFKANFRKHGGFEPIRLSEPLCDPYQWTY